MSETQSRSTADAVELFFPTLVVPLRSAQRGARPCGGRGSHRVLENVAEGPLFRNMQHVVRARPNFKTKLPGVHFQRVSKGNSILPPFAHATLFKRPHGGLHAALDRRRGRNRAPAPTSFAQKRPLLRTFRSAGSGALTMRST
jgi:hypothetical protein